MGTDVLMGYEVGYLLEALRRDARAEEERALADPEWATVHRFNARQDRHLLELLNPKAPRTGSGLWDDSRPIQPATPRIAHEPGATNEARSH